MPTGVSLQRARFRLWLGAMMGVPIAVGAALAMVFFLTLAVPVPASDDAHVEQAN